MSDLKLSGRLTKISGRIKKSEKFTMRLFVIETDGQYPQPVKFQLVNDRCDIIDGVEIGDDITVHFDIRGNEWEGKIINNLNAWKVVKQGNQTTFPESETEHHIPNDTDIPF